CQQGYSNPVTF
nr:immunoglobulin light chain junction region [Macaca mulatta]